MEIYGEISMEFHGNWCPNPPWNSMENFPWNSMEVFHTGKTRLSCMCKKTKMNLAVLCTTKLVPRWSLYNNNKKKLEYNQSGNMSQVAWRSQTFLMNFSTRTNRLECGWCNQKWIIRGIIIFVANVWAKQKISLRNLVQVCLQNKKPDLSQ